MANSEHLKLINQGAPSWNRWREANPDIIPDLSWANLIGLDLSTANFEGANLKLAYFKKSNLQDVNLRGSNLKLANLDGADLHGADLSNVKKLTVKQLINVKTLKNTKLDSLYIEEIQSSSPELFK